jgi:hypothetical protein
MVSIKHVINWSIPEMQMPGLREHAKMKCLGLGSKIRGMDFTDDQLFQDQIIGVACTLVGVKAVTGSNELYYRHIADTGDKWTGDGGTDVPGARIDFKGSLMRYSDDPLRYNLLIRPKEFHPHTTYILILVKEIGENGARGHIVGWMDSWEIEEKTEPDRRFGDAFCIPARKLHPFPRFRWGEE